VPIHLSILLPGLAQRVDSPELSTDALVNAGWMFLQLGVGQDEKLAILAIA
jgi:hypothetical protein